LGKLPSIHFLVRLGIQRDDVVGHEVEHAPVGRVAEVEAPVALPPVGPRERIGDFLGAQIVLENERALDRVAVTALGVALRHQQGALVGRVDREAVDANGGIAATERERVDDPAGLQVDDLDVLPRRLEHVEPIPGLVQGQLVGDPVLHADPVDDLLGRLVPDEDVVRVGRDVPRRRLLRAHRSHA
jgi:hypothetical protein